MSCPVVIEVITPGPPGPAGPTGPTGVGSAWLQGAGAPGGEIGADGDFYLNTETGDIYGPLTDGDWGPVVFNIAEGQAGPQGPAGEAGPAGPAGVNGRTVLNGSGAPGSGVGANGDFYVDTANWVIYGPKAAGAWPGGASLIGPVGTQGAVGPFSRNGGASTVGVQLQEVSNNVTLLASTGVSAADTAPTQFAVRSYADGRFLAGLTATAGQPLTITDTSTQDGSGFWTRSRNIELSLNAPNGLARLDGSGLIPSALLPSYVDDVIEAANLAAFPATGESGKIYVALDSGKSYRWGGSAYVEVSPSPGSTDAVPEGSINLYFTTGRAAAAAPVQSVAGRSGAVTLSASDISGLGTAATTAASAYATAAQGAKADTAVQPAALSGYVQTSDARLADAREWSADTISQAEAETGTATTRRAFTAERVFQAVAAWWAASSAKTKLDGIASGATANATDAQLRDRSTHTGTQTAGTITGLAEVATSGSASDLSTGTLPAARLPATTVTAGSYTNASITVGEDGRLTAASSGTATSIDPVIAGMIF